MRPIPHNYAPGDTVLYQPTYTYGYRIGEILTIGRQYASFERDDRIHIPKIKAKLKAGADAVELVRCMEEIDRKRRESEEAAARIARDAREALFEQFCDRRVRD